MHAFDVQVAMRWSEEGVHPRQLVISSVRVHMVGAFNQPLTDSTTAAVPPSTAHSRIDTVMHVWELCTPHS
jgi:hypothetical protein